ncbi:MAG: ATP-binding protein, partial [Candidatus Rokuibacteriota bacterium]
PERAVPAASVAAEPPAPGGVRWDRRRLTLLRAVVTVPAEPTSEVHRVPEILVDKVQTFGGRVEDLGTTGIVAAFGIEPYEDAPRRAALAAIAILKAGQRMSEEAAGRAPTFRVALHTGQLTLGRLGDAIMIDQQTKGEAWVVLDELTGRTGPDAILVSEAAAPFLHRRFVLTPVEPRAPGAGQAYRLAGLEPTGGSFRSRLARFVGRQQEVELLRSRLESAARGQGQIVGITGDAGIGKSRLLFEFRQSLADRAIVCLEGHCLSYGRAVPYLPVLDILRASCGITDADSPGATADKLRAGLEALAMDPRDVSPYLLQLLGLEGGTERLGAMTPEVIKARTFEALRQMSVRRSRTAPLILVVEDLHWIDKTSEEYLASLAEISAGARIIMVATYRPGYRPPWIDKSYATQMALQPLAPADSRSVVESVLGTGELTGSVLEGILAKAEGNPFFLEELARAVREQGALGPSLPVPDTIEEVILARIDRLSAADRKLLQEASVVGKDVPFAILQAVAELPEPALRRGLLRLTAAEFLYETSPGAELEYTFKHALTHEVAYGSLLPDQRRALHGRIMTALEAIFQDRLPEQLERLAHHAFRGEAWDKAVVYLRDAGAKAAMRSAYPEAVVCFEQALEALSRLPATPVTLEQAIDVRFELRNSLFPLGEIARDLEHLREAEALAETLNDQRRLAWVSAYMARDFSLMGDQEAALQSGKRALAIAIDRRDFPLEVLTNAYLGAAYHALGEYRRSIETLRDTLASLEGDRSHERFGLPGPASMFFRTWLVWSLAKVGDFAEGITWGEEAIRIAESVDQPLSLTVSAYSLGFLYLHRAAFDTAVPLLERSLDLCQTWNLRAWFPLIASSLGSALVLSGRGAEGTPFLEQAVERAFAMRLFMNQSSRLTWLGESLLLGGRAKEARQVTHRALELARAHRERGHEAYALRLFGEIAAESDPPDRAAAEAHYRQAIALADELGMRPLLAQCHLGLGTLLRRAGRAPEARARLATATALLQALEMRFWLGHAEAEAARAG